MSAMRSGPSSQQLLSHLEALLTQAAEPSRQEVEAAHSQASAAIRKVNERLTQAHQLISSGRRAEAIEIAEGPPHVLDEIAILDSQMIRDWEHYSGQFGLPRFAPLRGDLASLLNGAYTSEHQLKNLLRRHRTLSIGRANLKQRIATLSDLVAADPSSSQWTKSLRECQQARLTQIANRASSAIKIGDLRCLRQLMTELRTTKWVAQIPKSLVDSISGAIARLQSQESTTEAIAIAEHAQDAYSCGDQARLGPLIRRYREIQRFVDEPSAGQVITALKSIIAWFDDDQEQQRVAEAQSKALAGIGQISDRSDAVEIRQVMEGIATTGAAVPTELRDAYVQKVQADASAKRLKAMLIAGGVAAVMLVTVTAAAITYRSYQNEAAMKELATAIENNLKSGDLEISGRLIASSPLSDPRFAPLRKLLDERKMIERERAKAFEAEAEKIAVDLAEAKQVDEFDRLKFRLNDLIDRVKTDSETDSVTRLSKASSAARQARLDARVAEATEANQTVRRELKLLVPVQSDRPTLAKWNQHLMSFRTDRWLSDKSELTSELSATIDLVADQYDIIRERATVENQLAKITDSVGDWDAWNALADDVENADPAIAGKLTLLAESIDDESELWEGIDEWNAIVADWKVDELLTATPTSALAAKKAVALINRAGLTDLPAAVDFMAAAEVATPVADRTARTLELLVAHLKSAKMSGIGAVKLVATETASPRWHYFPVDRSGSAGESIRVSGESLRIQSYVDLTTVKTESSLVPFESVKLPLDFAAKRDQYLSGTQSLFAPHVSLCRDLGRTLTPLPEDPLSWDRAFVTAYRDVMAARSIDPLVQFFLAGAVLDIGAQGSWLLTHAYQPHRDLIANSGVSTEVDWIAPGNREAEATRRQATETLAKLQQLSPINPKQKLADMRVSLSIGTRYVPIGWIDQHDGRWIVRVRPEVREHGILLVRRPGGGNDSAGAAIVTPIGRLADGKAILDADSLPAALRIGRPAWLAIDSDSEENDSDVQKQDEPK